MDPDGQGTVSKNLQSGEDFLLAGSATKNVPHVLLDTKIFHNFLVHNCWKSWLEQQKSIIANCIYYLKSNSTRNLLVINKIVKKNCYK